MAGAALGGAAGWRRAVLTARGTFSDFPRYLGASTIGTGLVASVLPTTGPALLVYQAAQAGRLTPEQTASWYFALFVGSGLLTYVLALFYRQPINGAYPIAGTALMASLLPTLRLEQAIGAYLISGALITLIGMLGLFGWLMKRLPQAILLGVLAGVLLRFGLGIFGGLGSAPVLVAAMLAAYLLTSRLPLRLPPALAALLVGVGIAVVQGTLNLGRINLALATPQLSWPEFVPATFLSVALPLTLLNLASQNAPGIAILRAEGYDPPVKAITLGSGIFSLLTAPLGGNGINIAAPLTAICASPDAHPDLRGRYVASVVAATVMILFGLFGSTATSLFGALPAALTAAVAGLSLLPVLLTSLRTALAPGGPASGALVAFLITAADLSLFGLGAAFWAVVGGLLAAWVLDR